MQIFLISRFLSASAVHPLFYIALVEVCGENLASPVCAVRKGGLRRPPDRCQDPQDHTLNTRREKRQEGESEQVCLGERRSEVILSSGYGGAQGLEFPHLYQGLLS